MKSLSIFLLYGLSLCWLFPRLVSCEIPPKTDLKVAFAGVGRVGTASLAAALQRLGYHTCHGLDMTVDVDKFKNLSAALKECDGDQVLKEVETLGCDATLEITGMFFKDFRKRRPNAKFIIMLRDYEKWEVSVQSVYYMMQPLLRYPLRFFPPIEELAQLSAKSITCPTRDQMPTLAEQFHFVQNPNDKDVIAIRKKFYEDLVEELTEFARSDPHRAMILDKKQGYQPLCEFLGVNESECPDEPFPHVNSGNFMFVTGLALRLVEGIFYLLPLMTLAYLARWILSRKTNNSAATGEGKKND